MGRELELSELAVMRPVRTTADSADGGATPNKLTGSKDGDEDAAADTGCVTPTAAAASLTPRRAGVNDDIGCVAPTTAVTSSLLPLQQGGYLDDTSSTGCVTPTAATNPPTTPLRSVVLLLVDDANAASYVTPTSAASILRPATECPPAPRKPARTPPVLKRKRCGGGGGAAPQRCFFPVPRDLTKVFVARGPAADDSGSPPQQAAKKVRVNPVG